MYLSTKMQLCLLSMAAFAARSITAFSIQQEGDACFDMAAAMPGLKTVISKYSSMLDTLFG